MRDICVIKTLILFKNLMSFEAMTMTGVSGVRYFARVFVRTGMGRGSSSTTASQLHLHHHSQLSVGSFRHSLDLSASAAEYLQDGERKKQL